MTEAEEFLLKFHHRSPGCTSAAFSRSVGEGGGLGSYELLSSLVNDDDVLDLGCGDGHLVSLVAQRPGCASAVGLDFSAAELRLAQRRHPRLAFVLAQSKRLPFEDQSFSLVLSHFAFHLMNPLEVVTDEIARVLRVPGRFAAIVGGGPKLGGSFEDFLDLVKGYREQDQCIPRIGDMRARTEEGLAKVFSENHRFSSTLDIVDSYVDFGGTFELLWPRLATTYDLVDFTPAQLSSLREDFRKLVGADAQEHIPCVMAVRLVIAQRNS